MLLKTWGTHRRWIWWTGESPHNVFSVSCGPITDDLAFNPQPSLSLTEYHDRVSLDIRRIEILAPYISHILIALPQPFNILLLSMPDSPARLSQASPR